MTIHPQQRRQCHVIIHSAAAAAAAGNMLPAPGTGLAVDLLAMTSMAMGLAGVFGVDADESMSRSLAIATLKNTALRQPIRSVTKELSKFVPGLGQVVAPSISAAMVEGAGWAMARQLAAQQRTLTVA